MVNSLTCMCASIGFLACCFVLGTPHHMLQERRSNSRAGLLGVRLSDVTSRQQLSNEEKVWKLYPCLTLHIDDEGQSRPSTGRLLVPWCSGAFKTPLRLSSSCFHNPVKVGFEKTVNSGLGLHKRHVWKEWWIIKQQGQRYLKFNVLVWD